MQHILNQNKQFILMAVLIIFVSASVSVTTSIILYQTALSGQKHDLQELAQSQAILAHEVIQHHSDMEKQFGIPFDWDSVINLIGKFQQKMESKSQGREYIVSVNISNKIRYLIINGQKISDPDQIKTIISNSEFMAPMYKAQIVKSIILKGQDSTKSDVITAYVPVKVADASLGIIFKIDIESLKKPFMIANAKVLAICVGLLLVGLFILYKLSRPFFKSIERNENEYRTLVENANSLILKVNSNGIISFANSFAINFLNHEEGNLVGLSFMEILAGKVSNDASGGSRLLDFFGKGAGPHERPCLNRKGDKLWIAWRTKITFTPEGEFQEVLCIGNDITSKYNALAKLKDSEARYKSIFENAPLGIIYVTREGILSDCNDNLLTTLGSKREDLIGISVNQIVNPKMRESIMKSMNGERSIFEDIYTPISGKNTLFLRAIFNPVLCEEPPFESIATIEDFTQRKKVELELAESEQRFKGLAKAAPVGIIITNKANNVQYANHRALQMCDTTLDQMEKNGWTNSLALGEKLNLFNKWFNTRPIVDSILEFKIRRNDEPDIWILGQIVEMRSTQDDASGFVITLTDITPLKDAELEHERLTAAIDQTAEAILITDTSGIITYANPAFESISGYSTKEVIGNSPNIIRGDEHDEEFYEELWKKINSGETWKGRIINLNKNGKRFTQDTTIAPVRNERGTIVNFVSVARDVSQQLVIEAQLRQAQKLESIGELAAGIAHEINTPTQYVATNVKFLEDTFADIINNLKTLSKIKTMVDEHKSCDQVVDVLSNVMHEEDINFLAEDIPNAIKESEEGLQKIANIVKSVKQLAHPGETYKSFHDINEIIRDAVTVSTNEWKYVADVTMQLDETLPSVNCLKGEMGQAILNLVVNSAHAIGSNQNNDSPNKGKIDVRTYSDEDSVVVEIKDSGCGMPKHVMEKAFDPFFTTKEIGKGTGQGLAIVYNVIVNIHNGSVVLNSEEGVGTTVTITLPISESGIGTSGTQDG